MKWYNLDLIRNMIFPIEDHPDRDLIEKIWKGDYELGGEERELRKNWANSVITYR